MNYEIYMDESMNTGNPCYKDGRWNFADQPYFALGSICIEEVKRDSLTDNIKATFAKYDKEIGITKELKSTKKYKFKYELLDCIIKDILRCNAMIYIDISNKKYKIIMNLIEYCVYPYYIQTDPTSDSIREKKILAAKHVFYNISDEILQQFIEICCENIKDNEIYSYNKLLDFLHVLHDKIVDKNIKKQIKLVKEYISEYKKHELTINNLFPIQDLTNSNKAMSFLPNLDAFLNVVVSTTNLRLLEKDQLCIYHDKQKEFSQSFIKWVEKLKSELKVKNLDKVLFCESKDNVLIQAVDFITGITLSYFIESINGSNGKNSKNLKTILRPIIINCNIVSIPSEQEEFFKHSNIKSYKTEIPYFRY